MRAALITLAALIALAACSPPPRDATYFEAHAEEAAKVVADCAAGTHRGEECANAQAAEASIRRKARMDTYRKAF